MKESCLIIPLKKGDVKNLVKAEAFLSCRPSPLCFY